MRVQATDPLNHIWPEAWTIISLVPDGVRASRNANVTTRLGGALVAIGPHFCPFVSTHGIPPSGRAIWVHFDHPNWGNFGIVNVYTPNSNAERLS